MKRTIAILVVMTAAAAACGIAYLTLRSDGESVSALPETERGYLGVLYYFEAVPHAQARRLGVEHVLFVGNVVPGSPAAAAGIRAGDAIVRIDGAAIPFPDDTKPLGSAWRPGQIVRFEILRSPDAQAEPFTVAVTLMDHAAFQQLVPPKDAASRPDLQER